MTSLLAIPIVRWDHTILDLKEERQLNLTRKQPPAETPVLSDAEGGSVAATIILTANLIRRSGNVTYRNELGLAPAEWIMIARLGQLGPMTQRELSERTLLDKGQLSRVAARLARKRLILRQGRTWRSFELRLAPAGEELYATIRRLSRLRNAALSADISARDLRQFFSVLDKIAVNASNLLQTVKSQADEDP
jgi:DNA-binding MarR family transcriptional regulator